MNLDLDMNTFEQMTERGHERVCFHYDRQTGLRAIIALHSSALGNALGGTRRWHYGNESEALHDVLRLSEGMTYKCACAGLPMGGGKSVILLPSPGAQPTEAEARAMGRFVDTFNGVYIAAEDVGVDTQFVDWMGMETEHVMGGETVSRGGDPSPYTARGVFSGMKAALAHQNRAVDFSGLKVAVQGIGQVGYYLIELLLQAGANVIATDISDARIHRALALGDVTIVDPDEILTTPCDILAPCALGGVIGGTNIQSLNCSVLCGGANNILVDPDEDAVLLKNSDILYPPDFVVNSGGVIELSGLYLGWSRDELDRKHEEIEATTAEILRKGDSMSSTYAAAIAVACQRIENAARENVHAG